MKYTVIFLVVAISLMALLMAFPSSFDKYATIVSILSLISFVIAMIMLYVDYRKNKNS